MAELKFYHLGSDATMGKSGLQEGGIYFEPKTGRIHVATSATTSEPYGGRISDAAFKENVLTLSFNDGTDNIVLDFTDTASASGVNAILKQLRTDLGTTADAANANGSAFARIAKNKADIADEATRAKGAEDLIKGRLDKLEGDGDGSVAKAVATAKSEITGTLGNNDLKTIKALSDKVLGADLAQVGADGSYIKLVSQEDGKVSATAQTFESSIIPAGEGKEAGASTTNAPTAKAVVDYVATEISTVNTAATGLGNRVTALEATHAKNADNTFKTVQEEAAAEVAKVVASAPEAFDTLKEIADWIGSGDVTSTTAATMLADINKLKGDASTEGSVAKAVADAKSALLGKDTDAAGDATITGANKAAAAASTAAGAEKTRAEAAEALLAATHAKVGGDGADKDNYKTVAQEVTDGINALDADIKSDASATYADKGTFVNVEVVETDGKITAVKIAESDIQSAATYKADVTDKLLGADTVVGSVANAKKAGTDAQTTADAVKASLGESTATAGTDTAYARIKSLEDKQSSGSLTWAQWTV